jgi:hypothetical protein
MEKNTAVCEECNEKFTHERPDGFDAPIYCSETCRHLAEKDDFYGN